MCVASAPCMRQNRAAGLLLSQRRGGESLDFSRCQSVGTAGNLYNASPIFQLPCSVVDATCDLIDKQRGQFIAISREDGVVRRIVLLLMNSRRANNGNPAGLRYLGQ